MNDNFWITTKILVVIFGIVISLYFMFSMLSSPTYDVKAFKGKDMTTTSSSISTDDTSPEKVNTSSSTSLAAKSNNPCIAYDPTTRTITVSCTNPTRLTDVNNALHDNSILAKQSSNDVWFLNANLVISKGAIFHIDSTDTKWLKISSKVTRSAGTTKLGPAYWIDIHGSLKIDSVKITSWDPTTNFYAKTNGSRTGTDIFIQGTPRPSIVVENNATGTTDITNSEIAYLGYEQGKHKGGSGLSYYYGGDGSIIKNNIIREVYFGLYTFGVGHMIVENNIIRNSGHYGLDPHTGTHDMIIRNNTVYNNNGSGIICSLNCYNILIENNKVHDNAENGIDFSRNMSNSIARYNIVYHEPSGIFVSQSHNNQIYNNTISKSDSAINVNTGSSNNKISGNTISNSLTNAILLTSGATGNTFASNRISGSTPESLKIEQDSTSKNNIFLNNQILHSSS